MAPGEGGRGLLVGTKKEDEEKERDLGVPVAGLARTVRTSTSVPTERAWHSKDRVTCG